MHCNKGCTATKDALQQRLLIQQDQIKQMQEEVPVKQKLEQLEQIMKESFVAAEKKRREEIEPLLHQVESMQLEALGAGVLQFSYRYDTRDQQLMIRVSFQRTEPNKLIFLTTYAIKAEKEDVILSAWQQFNYPDTTEFRLEESKLTRPTRPHNEK
jgi:hypothetical protein